MKVLYIADDGKEFDDKFECEKYEWLLEHSHLKDIKCYDKDGNLFPDIMSDKTYDYCTKVIVPTKKCVKEIQDLADYMGFCLYLDITEPGTWIFLTDGEIVKED